MDIGIIVTSLFFILLGLLVKNYPDLIAGYNTMSEEKKKNVDIEGLSGLMRNSFVAIGLMLPAAYFLLKYSGLQSWANSALLLVVLGGILVMMFKAQKYDKNIDSARRNKIGFISFIIIISAIAAFAIYGYNQSEAVLTKRSLKFSGAYGFELNFSEIDTLFLTESLPEIKLRTNGFSFADVKKGNYQLEDVGSSILMVQSSSGPYLRIIRKNKVNVFINFKDEEETKLFFQNLKEQYYSSNQYKSSDN